MFQKIVVLVFCLASVQHLTEAYGYGSRYDTIRTLRRFGALAQALKYGDNCSWEAEKSRQNYTKTIAAGNYHAVITMANEFLEKDYKLCSSAELFVCDEESQKCVCGDSGYETYQGINRSLYISEANGRCRWNTDTYCVSEEFLSSSRMLGFTVDSKCKTGTTCRTGGGQVCSKSAMIHYLMSEYGFMIILNERRLRQELMSGRVCSCKVDQIEDDSIEWDAMDFEPSLTPTTTYAQTTQEPVTDDNDVVSFVDAPASEVEDLAATSTTTANPGHNSVFSDEWETFSGEGSARRRKRSIASSEFQMKMIGKYAAGPVVATYMK